MGRKRHALVDTDGRTLEIFLHPASVQDRDGGPPVINSSRGSSPFIEKSLCRCCISGAGPENVWWLYDCDVYAGFRRKHSRLDREHARDREASR